MNGQKTIRTFIAVHLPDTVKTELGLVNDVLAGQVPAHSVRWVQPNLMHLTLRFLGETAVADLPVLTANLDKLAAQYAPLTLQLDNLGCFPNRSRPRVIWVGLTGETNALLQLQGDVETAVAALGWPREDKPFRAHLTLGRVKDGRLLKDVAWGTAVKKLAVPVTAVHLIESQLRPSGPIYTIRHTSQLRKP
ncbi:MAG: RNA 2',3'-cyclic phosphodiesterase [Chloroflexota bacterium]